MVTKYKDHLYLTAPVLVPGEKDCDYCNGEIPLTVKQIEHIAYQYLENHRIVDKHHDYFQTKNNVGVPVESYTTKEETTLTNIEGETRTYPIGTWIATIKITDKNTMHEIETGVIKGYSVTALSKEDADKQSIKSRVLIKDLKEPVGFTISLVDKPCVHGAILTSIKDKMEENKMTAKKEDKNILENRIEEAANKFVEVFKNAFKDEDEDEDKTEKSKKKDDKIIEKTEKTEETNEYVTKSDLEANNKALAKTLPGIIDESVKSNIKEAVNEAIINALKEETNENEDEDKKKKEKKEESKESNEKDKNKKPNGSSKSLPHNESDTPIVEKSFERTVYEGLGRDYTGSIKKITDTK